MTETLKAKSLFEISTVCIIATLIGLAVFWILKRINQRKEQVESPSLTSEKIIPTKQSIQIDVFDLMIVIGIILFFYANQVLAYLAPLNNSDQEALSDSKTDATTGIGIFDILLSNIIFVIVGAVIFSLASFSRGRHPNHVFGLKNRSRKYIVITTMIGMFVAYIAVFIGSVISNLLLSNREPKKENLQEIVQTLMANDDISLIQDRIVDLVKAGLISKKESDSIEDLIADYVVAQHDSGNPAAAASVTPVRAIMDLSEAFTDDKRFARQLQRSLATKYIATMHN